MGEQNEGDLCEVLYTLCSSPHMIRIVLELFVIDDLYGVNYSISFSKLSVNDCVLRKWQACKGVNKEANTVKETQTGAMSATGPCRMGNRR